MIGRSHLSSVLSEAKSAKGRVILFIDGLDELVAEDEKDGNVSTANLLEVALARNELRIIGASAPEAFHQRPTRIERLRGKLQGILINGESNAESDANEAVMVENQSEAFVGDKISSDLRELIQNSNQTDKGVLLSDGALLSDDVPLSD